MMTGATPAFGAADHIKGNGERKEQKKEGKQTRSDAATPVLCVGGSRVSKIVGPPRRSFHLESHQRVVWTVPRSASVHAIQACSHRPIFADGSPPPKKEKKMRETVFFLSSLSPGFTSGLVVGLNQPIGWRIPLNVWTKQLKCTSQSCNQSDANCTPGSNERCHAVFLIFFLNSALVPTGIL